MAVHCQPGGAFDQCFGPDCVAHPPASHGVGLAPTIKQDESVGKFGIGQQRDVLVAFVGDPRVDFIAQHRHMRMFGKACDEPVNLMLWYGTASRIGW